MNTLATSLLAGTTLAVAATAGTSYYMGGKIQEAIVQTAASWAEDTEVSVRLVDYQRGLFTSSARSVWTFAGSEKAHEITVTHDIRHGPFPRGFAAQVHSDFQIPQDIDAELARALQGKTALRWTVQVRWNQEARHHLQSDSLEVRFDDGSTLSWGGLQAEWTVDPETMHIQGSAHLPLLAAQTPDTQLHLRMHNLQLRADHYQSAQYGLWSGPLHLQLEQLEIQAPDAPTFKLQQVQIEGSTRLEEHLVHLQVHAQAAQAGPPEHPLREVQLQLAFKNIDAQWFAQAWAWLSNTSEDEAQSWELLRNLPQLLAGQPEIAITHLAFQTPDGITEMAAHMNYQGPDPEAFALMDLNARLQATLPQPVLEQLLAAKVRGDYMELLQQMGQQLDEDSLGVAIQDGVRKRLQGLINQGAVQPAGNRYRAELLFDQEGFQLNGQPIQLHDLLMLGEAM